MIERFTLVPIKSGAASFVRFAGEDGHYYIGIVHKGQQLAEQMASNMLTEAQRRSNAAYARSLVDAVINDVLMPLLETERSDEFDRDNVEKALCFALNHEDTFRMALAFQREISWADCDERIVTFMQRALADKPRASEKLITQVAIDTERSLRNSSVMMRTEIERLRLVGAAASENLEASTPFRP